MKKGFTLIEIIVVIVLLSVIGVGTSIAVIKVNDKQEQDVLVKNEKDFKNALDVYLTNHNEVINNINNNSEGAVISLELLKNEGLISDKLDINYKDNYYIVIKALLSNKNLEEECENSIGLNTIASWVKDEDSSKVLYFCPKKAEEDTIDLTEKITNPAEYCDESKLLYGSLACQIISSAKKAKNEKDVERTAFVDVEKKTQIGKPSFYYETKEEIIDEKIINLKGYREIIGRGLEYKVNSETGEISLFNNTFGSTKSKIIYDEEEGYYAKVRDYSGDTTETNVYYINEVIDKNQFKTNKKITSVFNYEKSLRSVRDDYGISYYFRGNVNDNYVKFNNMDWRIVRILGNGAVMLANVTNAINSVNYGYINKTIEGGFREKDIKVNINNFYSNNSNSLSKKLENFQTSKLYGVLDKLYKINLCVGESINTEQYLELVSVEVPSGCMTNCFDSFKVNYSTNLDTLECIGNNILNFSTNIGVYVGTLTANEFLHAGASYNGGNYNYYLKGEYLTLTPSYIESNVGRGTDIYVKEYIYSINKTQISETLPDVSRSIIPTITLIPGIKSVSGDGTIDNPYIIDEN